MIESISHRLLLSIVVSILCFTNVYSTHMVGGDFSYTCLGSNKYKIKLVLFQDCKDGEVDAIKADNPLNYAIYTSDGSGATSLFAFDRVFSISTDTVPTEFSNDCVSSFPSVCLRREVFEFVVTLPATDYGYTFVYQRCCRNENIANITDPGNNGVTYSVFIPPFGDNICSNNSAYFDKMPPQIICSSYPFSYSFKATDIDGDSLVYRLCKSFIGASTSNPSPAGSGITPPPFTPANYAFGYSFDNPIPAFPPLSIDPNTGVMTMTPTANGRFQVTVCVDEYRDGVYLSTISRDLQIVVFNCKRTVYADIPILSDEPNTYIVECTGYTVNFKNTSVGGFTYFWEFGDGATSSLFEPSHTYADTGEYEVTLYVNRGESCADSITRLVKIYPFHTNDFNISGILCPGEEIKFDATINNTLPDSNMSYHWDFGDGSMDTTSLNTTHIYDSGGEYIVRFFSQNKYGCSYTKEYPLDISQINTFAGNDTIIVLGYEFYLNGQGAEDYQWTPSTYLSNPNIANPQVFFTDTGEYTYILKGIDGDCIDYDTINILVVKDPSILMPSAFSPNGDGKNDLFKPVIVGYPLMKYYRVFNRWGQMVYISYKLNEGWNGTFKGKQADQGVYFWDMMVENVNGEEKYVKGDVTLVR